MGKYAPVIALDPAAVERRRMPRKRVLLSGVIADANGENAIDCIIRDMNVRGAQVQLPRTLQLRGEVYLVDTRNEAAHLATVAWIKTGRTGLSFVRSYSLEATLPPQLEFLGKLLIEAKLSPLIRGLRVEGAPETIHFVGEQETRNALLSVCTHLRCRLESFASVAEFIAVAPTLELGCLVADIDSLDAPGTTFLAKLEAMGVAFPIILIGDHLRSQLSSWPRLTIVEILQKPLTADLLIQSLRKAQQFLRARSANELDLARLELLTKEERDVLTGIVAGMTNKAIASSLRMDIREVELCRINLLKTLGVNSLSELVHVALAGGIRVLR